MKTKDLLLGFVDVWSKQNNIYSKQCTVTSIDVNKRICNCAPVDGSAEIVEVSLEADIAINSSDEPKDSHPKGFFIVPKLNSLVTVSFTSKGNGFLSSYTEIEDVIIKSTSFTFNDGSYGGLIKVSDLIDRLKEYEDLFTQLKTDLNAWTPVPQDGGLALKTILISGFLTKTVPSSNVSEFENDKIVHG